MKQKLLNRGNHGQLLLERFPDKYVYMNNAAFCRELTRPVQTATRLSTKAKQACKRAWE